MGCGRLLLAGRLRGAKERNIPAEQPTTDQVTGLGSPCRLRASISTREQRHVTQSHNNVLASAAQIASAIRLSSAVQIASAVQIVSAAQTALAVQVKCSDWPR